MPKKVFLLPGELCVKQEETEMATLLGSCVAVCLFNRKLKFGGMNHYMLARSPEGDPPTGKHGDYSTDLLIKMMLSVDNSINNLEASVIGGAAVNSNMGIGMGVGANNIVMARTILDQYGIRVIRRSVGGEHGRKVYFKNWTGEIELRRIEKSQQSKIIDEKKKTLASRKIRVLIVDDSDTIRAILRKGLQGDPDIEVVGEAANPYEAREMLLETDPDVICLDIIMPKMDGITFLKKIMQFKPKPVIIISTVAQKGSDLRKQAERIGAVEVIDKEDLELYKGIDTIRNILLSKVKTAASTWVKKKSASEINNC